MTIDECVTRLSERYDKDLKTVIVEDFKLWLERQNINSLQLDVLYNTIIENWQYKTFPPHAKIKEWWGAGRVTHATNYLTYPKVLDETKSWSVDKILTKFEEVSNKKNALGWDNLSPWNQCFFYVWDALHTYDWQLREKRWSELEITPYLEGVKASIVKGERIGYGTPLGDRRTPEEQDMAKAKRREQFEKLKTEMGKTFQSTRSA